MTKIQLLNFKSVKKEFRTIIAITFEDALIVVLLVKQQLILIVQHQKRFTSRSGQAIVVTQGGRSVDSI
jgi:hypothetical protein